MNEKKRKHWEEVVIAAKERLVEYDMWFPYPCIISYFLATLLIGHVVLGMNPRLGSPASIIPFSADPSYEGAIWLSISLQKQNVVVTTSDRKVFKWPRQEHQHASMQLLVDHLALQIENTILSTALAKSIPTIQSMVVLSIDQQVTMQQVQPILTMLAQVGVSDYAFETVQPPIDVGG